ncbi:DinB family protein [Neobacillus cucumis]|uniref:Damage-inducible protein DinB n=1 Tax=Neobacillus cucumis TaxID=1740721 RepID=A0A2N5H774_9BACI|nr:DinB family protein [Neobacillus cucumis]PLS01356.1 damage-inducible protein DinB [Neobacillus cucumis]
MKTIVKMYQHLDWANQRVLDALKTKDAPQNQAKLLFSHTLLAEEVWFNRIKGLESNPQAIWTELSIEGCSTLAAKNNQGFAELLAGLSETNLEGVIVYKNSTGKEFSNSIRDILTHVALHGQYHRGQINRLLREQGDEPVSLDYIMFVR